MSTVTFSQWLHEELHKRGWTQSELARRADLAQTTISALLRQKIRPGEKSAVRIADAFGYPRDTVRAIADLTDDPDPVTYAHALDIAEAILQLPPRHRNVLLSTLRLLQQDRTRAHAATRRHSRNTG